MVLKLFDMVLKFELPRAQCLNFPKNSASVLIRLVLIIEDCVYRQENRSRNRQQLLLVPPPWFQDLPPPLLHFSNSKWQTTGAISAIIPHGRYDLKEWLKTCSTYTTDRLMSRRDKWNLTIHTGLQSIEHTNSSRLSICYVM